MSISKKSRGAGLIEYALTVAVIALVALAGVASFGTRVCQAIETAGTQVAGSSTGDGNNISPCISSTHQDESPVF